MVEESVDKSKIVLALKAEFQKNLDLAITAAQNTYDIATHEENKAENKYDTRGLEASYLAGAQAQRVLELKDAFQIISGFKINQFSQTSKAALSALIELESDRKTLWLFLLPKGGGQTFYFENKKIQVITPESPLGALLIGREIGDEFEFNGKTYEVKNLV